MKRFIASCLIAVSLFAEDYITPDKYFGITPVMQTEEKSKFACTDKQFMELAKSALGGNAAVIATQESLVAIKTSGIHEPMYKDGVLVIGARSLIIVMNKELSMFQVVYGIPGQVTVIHPTYLDCNGKGIKAYGVAKTEVMFDEKNSDSIWVRIENIMREHTIPNKTQKFIQ